MTTDVKCEKVTQANPTTVFVLDGKQLGSTPGVRVAVVAVGPSCEPPDLDDIVIEEKVPIVLWGDAGDVDRMLMDTNTVCAEGSRLVRLHLYIRPRVAALGPGMLFRELSIAILDDTGLLPRQVHPIPTQSPSCFSGTHACFPLTPARMLHQPNVTLLRPHGC